MKNSDDISTFQERPQSRPRVRLAGAVTHVIVAGNDVYAAGSLTKNNTDHDVVAGYWKNGVYADMSAK